MNLAFSTTACVRPELLDATYCSLSKHINVLLNDFDLVINIDPSPQDKTTQVLDVCKKYFSNVIYNMPETPNFCKAVKWCWSFDYDYLFHIEDDWEFISDIDLEEIISFFGQSAYQVSLRLTKHDFPRFYRLSPSVFSKEFYQKSANFLDINYNPEHQIGYPKVATGLTPASPKSLIIYPNNIAVKDIGRNWRKEMKIEKPEERNFIKWV